MISPTSWNQFPPSSIYNDRIDPNIHTFKPDTAQSQQQQLENKFVVRYKQLIESLQVKNKFKPQTAENKTFYPFKPDISSNSKIIIDNIDYIPPDRYFYPKVTKYDKILENQKAIENIRRQANPKLNQITNILTSSEFAPRYHELFPDPRTPRQEGQKPKNKTPLRRSKTVSYLIKNAETKKPLKDYIEINKQNIAKVQRQLKQKRPKSVLPKKSQLPWRQDYIQKNKDILVKKSKEIRRTRREQEKEKRTSSRGKRRGAKYPSPSFVPTVKKEMPDDYNELRTTQPRSKINEREMFVRNTLLGISKDVHSQFKTNVYNDYQFVKEQDQDPKDVGIGKPPTPDKDDIHKELNQLEELSEPKVEQFESNKVQSDQNEHEGTYRSEARLNLYNIPQVPEQREPIRKVLEKSMSTQYLPLRSNSRRRKSSRSRKEPSQPSQPAYPQVEMIETLYRPPPQETKQHSLPRQKPPKKKQKSKSKNRAKPKKRRGSKNRSRKKSPFEGHRKLDYSSSLAQFGFKKVEEPQYQQMKQQKRNSQSKERKKFKKHKCGATPKKGKKGKKGTHKNRKQSKSRSPSPYQDVKSRYKKISRKYRPKKSRSRSKTGSGKDSKWKRLQKRIAEARKEAKIIKREKSKKKDKKKKRRYMQKGLKGEGETPRFTSQQFNFNDRGKRKRSRSPPENNMKEISKLLNSIFVKHPPKPKPKLSPTTYYPLNMKSQHKQAPKTKKLNYNSSRSKMPFVKSTSQERQTQIPLSQSKRVFSRKDFRKRSSSRSPSRKYIRGKLKDFEEYEFPIEQSNTLTSKDFKRKSRFGNPGKIGKGTQIVYKRSSFSPEERAKLGSGKPILKNILKMEEEEEDKTYDSKDMEQSARKRVQIVEEPKLSEELQQLQKKLIKIYDEPNSDEEEEGQEEPEDVLSNLREPGSQRPARFHKGTKLSPRMLKMLENPYQSSPPSTEQSLPLRTPKEFSLNHLSHGQRIDSPQKAIHRYKQSLLDKKGINLNQRDSSPRTEKLQGRYSRQTFQERIQLEQGKPENSPYKIPKGFPLDDNQLKRQEKFSARSGDDLKSDEQNINDELRLFQKAIRKKMEQLKSTAYLKAYGGDNIKLNLNRYGIGGKGGKGGKDRKRKQDQNVGYRRKTWSPLEKIALKRRFSIRLPQIKEYSQHQQTANENIPIIPLTGNIQPDEEADYESEYSEPSMPSPMPSDDNDNQEYPEEELGFEDSQGELIDKFLEEIKTYDEINKKFDDDVGIKKLPSKKQLKEFID